MPAYAWGTLGGMGSKLWSAYVRAVVPSGERQEDTGSRAGQTQATISRWMSGKATPDAAAPVATFAQAYGRNVLEAFVAAGFLTEDDAGRGLPTTSRRFLASLREGIDSDVEGVRRAVRRGLRKSQQGDNEGLDQRSGPSRKDRRTG